MLLKSVYAFFLGWPIYLGVRRALRPALVEEPRGAAQRAADGAGSLGRDVPALRRARPADEQPPGAADRGLRRRRRWPSSWSSSSGSGTCRCSTATSTWPRRTTTAPASIRVSAPRGEILDRNGEVLVANRTSLALQVNPQKLPADAAERRAELARLAELDPHVRCAGCGGRCTKELKLAPGAPVTLRRDVGYYLVYYLQENQDRFPGGRRSQRVFVRRYPDGTLAAHILGNVGEITEEELKEPRYQGLRAGRRDRPGRRRVHLRPATCAGEPGADPDPGRRARPADARAAGSSRKPPVAGRQPEADDRRRRCRRPAKRRWPRAGCRGAFIAMNVHTGEILGHGLVSRPSNPAIFTRTDDPGAGRTTSTATQCWRR